VFGKLLAPCHTSPSPPTSPPCLSHPLPPPYLSHPIPPPPSQAICTYLPLPPPSNFTPQPSSNHPSGLGEVWQIAKGLGVWQIGEGWGVVAGGGVGLLEGGDSARVVGL
jgi:hypothetical protein